MKRQIHAHKGHARVAVEGHNLKLGRGGIREIEFFVQTQQLIAGGRQPELRVSPTLDALDRLAAREWITPADRRRAGRSLSFPARHRTPPADARRRADPFAALEAARNSSRSRISAAYADGRRAGSARSPAARNRAAPLCRPVRGCARSVAHRRARQPCLHRRQRRPGHRRRHCAQWASPTPPWRSARCAAGISAAIRRCAPPAPANASPSSRRSCWKRWRGRRSPISRSRHLTASSPNFRPACSFSPCCATIRASWNCSPTSWAPRRAWPRIVSRRPRVLDAMLDPGFLGKLPARRGISTRIVRARLDECRSYEEALDPARDRGAGAVAADRRRRAVRIGRRRSRPDAPMPRWPTS